MGFTAVNLPGNRLWIGVGDRCYSFFFLDMMIQSECLKKVIMGVTIVVHLAYGTYTNSVDVSVRYNVCKTNVFSVAEKRVLVPVKPDKHFCSQL